MNNIVYDEDTELAGARLKVIGQSDVNSHPVLVGRTYVCHVI